MSGFFPLWHLAHRSDWEAAQAAGEYRISTRGRTLDDEGFIHCSYPHQLGLVARTFYADDPEPLVILELDRAALADRGVRVRVEDVGGMSFPHVFGPIPPEAVVLVRPVELDADGGLHIGDPEDEPSALADELADVLASLAASPPVPPRSATGADA